VAEEQQTDVSALRHEQLAASQSSFMVNPTGNLKPLDQQTIRLMITCLGNNLEIF
jgi:hypothetical protein